MTTTRHVSPKGTNYLDLDTPSLLLDLDILENNITKMADFFSDLPCSLRPHAKTHKSPTIALKQIAAGAIGICCQKLGEAEIMAQHGIDDILITNQIVGSTKIGRLIRALEASPGIKVAADNHKNIEELATAMEASNKHLGVLLEIEVGMGRCGVIPGKSAIDLAKRIDRSPNLIFAGVMGYEGHCINILK